MPREIMYLIENNRRRIQLMEQAARLLYREWLVHLRFPGHEHVTITDGVPEGWTPATIADIWRVVTGKTPNKKKESYYGDDIPFIKTPDMHGNTLVISTDESLSEEGANTQANKTLPTRSILVSCLGPWVRLRLTDRPLRRTSRSTPSVRQMDRCTIGRILWQRT